jgi:hypothetical protein
LWGAIFETWVVSEILKHRSNRGEGSGLCYYRDQHGVEVDLVLESGLGVTLVEAKAGQTVSGEMLKPLARVQDVLASAGNVASYLVYAGDLRQDRSGATVLPWNEVHEESWGEGKRKVRRRPPTRPPRSGRGQSRRKR